MNRPIFSIVMPVYNCQKYVAEAVESILGQTFEDFEFIIVDDGSNDETVSIINTYQDKRIKLIQNDKNMGCYPSRNLGFDHCTGDYICIMDGDDVALSHRLESQYQFMENRTGIDITGSNAYLNSFDQETKLPSDHETLKVYFLENNFCIHPTICIRRSFLEKHKLRYDVRYIYSSDYDFLARSMRVGVVENMEEKILIYRRHTDQISMSHNHEQRAFGNQIRESQLVKLGLAPEDVGPRHLAFLAGHPLRASPADIDALLDWANNLVVINRPVTFYCEEILIDFLRKKLKFVQLTEGKSARAY